MSEWISVKDRLPKTNQNVDLWIEGESGTVGFYDPSRKGKRSGRTCDWFLVEKDWHAVGGLIPNLSPNVRATHWMPRPDPPGQIHTDC